MVSTGESSDELACTSSRKRKRTASPSGSNHSLSVVVNSNYMKYPRSSYEGWTPNVEQLSEARALRYLLGDLNFSTEKRSAVEEEKQQQEEEKQQREDDDDEKEENEKEYKEKDKEEEDDDDGIYITLTDFCVYRPRQRVGRSDTMAPLNDLLTRFGDGSLQFSGRLVKDSKTCFVKDVPFEILSIDGYNFEVTSVADKIYLRSSIGERLDVWYHLSLEPAPEYERFHSGFLWLADFAKHFTCYLRTYRETTLRDFKQHFYNWLLKAYPEDRTVQKWLAQYGQGRKDFRKVVAQNFAYLYRESTNTGVDLEGENAAKEVWKQVHPDFLSAVRKHRCEDASTTVTPFIYDCFKDCYFSDQLKSKCPSESAARESSRIWDRYLRRSYLGSKVDTHLSNGSIQNHLESSSQNHLQDRSVETGDVIGITRDEGGCWKDSAPMWYAYVHDTEVDKDFQKFLHVFWLYQPSDTICGGMTYPYSNELFFSDHCNCICKKSERIYVSDIAENLTVLFSAKPVSPENGHFIRQTYITQDWADQFVEFKEEHMRCEHRIGTGNLSASAENKRKYRLGQTVLFGSTAQDILEPGEIISIGDSFQIRLLARKERDHGVPSKPNELVYNDNLIRTIPASWIRRKCHVRFYTRHDMDNNLIPAPYSLDGVGDCWIITTCVQDGVLKDLRHPFPGSLKQGFDPLLPRGHDFPLSTLDLFCGLDSLYRGIHVAGATVCKSAVDIDVCAIHTALENSEENTAKDAFYHGSAVRYLDQVLHNTSHNVAPVGKIHFICAGSPCQGFSVMQPDKTSPESRKNASLVTLTLAFIDLYRPKYAILENVHGMTRPLGKKKDQHIFAQIICALVAMGYQTQTFHMDAFNHGTPAQRSRVFIAIAAPGNEPIEPPQSTHSSPGNISARALGKTANGESYGAREWQPTPFEYVNAAEATKHLPPIYDGAVGICVGAPDHILSRMPTFKKAGTIHNIPCYPRGIGLQKGIRQGLIDKDLIRFLKGEHSIWNTDMQNKSFTRVHPDLLFTTVTTVCTYEDARNGKSLHWNEPRPLSIAEARIAQDVPDHVVIIGTSVQQWKLIGNSVPYNYAVALGISLREARVKTLWKTKARETAQTPSANQASANFSATSASADLLKTERSSGAADRALVRSHESSSFVRDPFKYPQSTSWGVQVSEYGDTETIQVYAERPARSGEAFSVVLTPKEKGGYQVNSS